MSSREIYSLKGVGKEYPGPSGAVEVLKGVDLTLNQGETSAIVGASGSGKTTLLHILGTLDTPSKGSVFFQNKDVAKTGPAEKARLRNTEIGFVFQFHHLLAEFTAQENVAMPGLIGGMGRSKAMDMAASALVKVGLENRMDHRVTTLSGGERQRAAIARAILMSPKVLLADEPTGNLDEETGNNVAGLLLDLNRDLDMSLVVVTHNQELARKMGRIMELRSGELFDRC